MTSLPVFRTRLLPALAGALLALVAVQDAQAQQAPSGSQAAQGGYSGPPPRQPGGYSRLTLSDIWGPAKMPPPPVDFGPHFDFPPQPLNGAPLHDPYPD
ncbi:MAG: hypothetical protein AB7V40_01595 [Methyloceanibacter sp.]